MEEPESFIIQNVTMNYQYISDIRLQLDPVQVEYLTWWDAKVVRASRDLKDALRRGVLRKISQDEWDTKLERIAAKERKELSLNTKSNEMKTIETEDGKQFLAESIDAEKPYNKETEVNTAGYANDSLSYAIALENAQVQAELNGDELTVEDFAEKVQRDPGLVARLLRQQTGAVTSGTTRQSRAFVAQAPELGSSQTKVAGMKMSNMQRDGFIAGGDFNYTPKPSDDFGFDDDPAIAEEIDLEVDSLGDDEKGSVRRV